MTMSRVRLALAQSRPKYVQRRGAEPRRRTALAAARRRRDLARPARGGAARTGFESGDLRG